MLARGHPLGLTEALEDMRQEVLPNSDTRVGDHQFNNVVTAAELDANLTARGGELHGIAQQIAHHLLNALRIDPYDTDIRIEAALKCDAATAAGADRIDAGLNDVQQEMLRRSSRNLPGHARDIQQIIDQGLLGEHSPLHRF